MTVVTGQLFIGPVGSLPEEWKPIGYIGLMPIFQTMKRRDYIIVPSTEYGNDCSVVYPDDGYRVVPIHVARANAWLCANHCRDWIAKESLIIVRDGIAEYQAMGRRWPTVNHTANFTIFYDHSRTWIHHMRVYHPIEEYIEEQS